MWRNSRRSKSNDGDNTKQVWCPPLRAAQQRRRRRDSGESHHQMATEQKVAYTCHFLQLLCLGLVVTHCRWLVAGLGFGSAGKCCNVSGGEPERALFAKMNKLCGFWPCSVLVHRKIIIIINIKTYVPGMRVLNG